MMSGSLNNTVITSLICFSISSKNRLDGTNSSRNDISLVGVTITLLIWKIFVTVTVFTKFPLINCVLIAAVKVFLDSRNESMKNWYVLWEKFNKILSHKDFVTCESWILKLFSVLFKVWSFVSRGKQMFLQSIIHFLG